MSRKILIIFTLVYFSLINTTLAKQKMLITVNQFINHISLNAIQDGLNEALSERQIIPNRANLIIGNAQGSISNSVQISKHHASLNPEFMVAIATAAAQTNLKAMGSNTILAFAAVTDPNAANLTGRDNVIGVTDYPPLDELINIAKQVFPKLKKVGVVFNSGEVNSVKIIQDLKKILDKHNIKLQKVSITSSNDIKNAMNQLIGKVDFIYLPQDNSVVSALDNISNISRTTKTPLLASDPILVEKGVLLALGTNYFKTGKKLGNMIADIMDGKKLDTLIQNTSIKELKINQDLAKEMGIEIPENLIKKN